MSKVQIKISVANDAPPSLHPGELAYSYRSGKLYIGPPGKYLDKPGPGIIELLDTNGGNEFITQTIQSGDTGHAPNSDAVFNALQDCRISVEYNDGSNTDPDIKTLSFDGNLDVSPDPNDSSKMLISAKPYWGNINIDDVLDAVTPNNKYENLKFKSGSGLTISVDNDKINFAANVNDNNVNGDPNELWSSAKVLQAIQNTAGVSPSADNDFIGINTFPDIDILNADPLSKQVVNTSSVKSYVGTVATQIVEGLSLIKYVFDTPGVNWVVTHNKNTDVFQYEILDDTGNKMLAPVDVIDSNSFVVQLTEAMTGSVMLRF